MLLTGDNLLAIVRAIIDTELLADPTEYRHGHVIYFDFVGLFMVILPVRLGTFINITTTIFVMLRFVAKLLKSGHGKRDSFFFMYNFTCRLVTIQCTHAYTQTAFKSLF